MCVSQALCEQYLPLLFTAVDRETHSQVRTTIMIGLGDLAFRFPNALEPWTAQLYLRYDTIMVVIYVYNTVYIACLYICLLHHNLVNICIFIVYTSYRQHCFKCAIIHILHT